MENGQYRQRAWKIIVYKQIDLLTNILKQLDHEKQVSEIQKSIQKAVQPRKKEQQTDS